MPVVLIWTASKTPPFVFIVTHVAVFLPQGSNKQESSGELCCVCESLQAWPGDQIPKTPDTACSSLMSADVLYLQEKQRGHSPGNRKLPHPPTPPPPTPRGSQISISIHAEYSKSHVQTKAAHIVHERVTQLKKKQKKTSVSDSGLPKKLRVSRHRSKAH